jgi:hypothetical protein
VRFEHEAPAARPPLIVVVDTCTGRITGRYASAGSLVPDVAALAQGAGCAP